MIKALSSSIQNTFCRASVAAISTTAHQRTFHHAEESYLASLSVAVAAGLTCMSSLSITSSCESQSTPVLETTSSSSIPTDLDMDHVDDGASSSSSSSSPAHTDTPSLEDFFQALQSTVLATSSSYPSYNLHFSATSPAADVDPVDMSEAEIKLEEATLRAKKHAGALKLFSGNGNMALSLEIARILGIHLGKATVSRFPDGEVNVQIHENVRGKDVYIIQPTCPPVNDNIMELLLMVSTLNRASARRITVVIPYYGYARQDRKMQVR